MTKFARHLLAPEAITLFDVSPPALAAGPF